MHLGAVYPNDDTIVMCKEKLRSDIWSQVCDCERLTQVIAAIIVGPKSFVMIHIMSDGTFDRAPGRVIIVLGCPCPARTVIFRSINIKVIRSTAVLILGIPRSVLSAVFNPYSHSLHVWNRHLAWSNNLRSIQRSSRNNGFAFSHTHHVAVLIHRGNSRLRWCPLHFAVICIIGKDCHWQSRCFVLIEGKRCLRHRDTRHRENLEQRYCIV